MTQSYFHVCYVVPDLEAAMTELTAAMGVQWEEPRDRASGEMRWRLVYSVGTPPLVELVEGQAGTPWHAADGPRMHHLGGFTVHLAAALQPLAGAGGPIELASR